MSVKENYLCIYTNEINQQVAKVSCLKQGCEMNVIIITGCPKSSFLYFISLYFSMIELAKQII